MSRRAAARPARPRCARPAPRRRRGRLDRIRARRHGWRPAPVGPVPRRPDQPLPRLDGVRSASWSSTSCCSAGAHAAETAAARHKRQPLGRRSSGSRSASACSRSSCAGSGSTADRCSRDRGRPPARARRTGRPTSPTSPGDYEPEFATGPVLIVLGLLAIAIAPGCIAYRARRRRLAAAAGVARCPRSRTCSTRRSTTSGPRRTRGGR